MTSGASSIDVSMLRLASRGIDHDVGVQCRQLRRDEHCDDAAPCECQRLALIGGEHGPHAFDVDLAVVHR